jgi:hypothetical protein
MKMFKPLFFLSLISLTLLPSCKDDAPATNSIIALTYKDLNADYAPLVLSQTGPPTRPAQKNKYTFFNFEKGTIVANTDSASTKWDIGFRSTSIIFNSGTSGPGAAGVIVQKDIFDGVSTAPTIGYTTDNYNKLTKAGTFAISTSPFVDGVTTTTNNWWLNSGTNTSTIITPIAGRVFIVKTADGKYVKMEILSYYKGAPASVNNLIDLDRYYTFRYVYQGDGTTKLN